MSDISRAESTIFDSLRKEDLSGEYWAARELAKAFGYDEFRKFETVIERADVAVRGLGMEPLDHIARVGAMVSIGSGAQRAVAEYRVTRFGAYMIAQNGDSRKVQVAAAQAYFAQQTRRQELAQAAALNDDEIVARALQITSRRVHELEAQIAIDAPKVEAYETLMDADGAYSMDAAAKILGIGRTTLFNRLRAEGIIQAGQRTPYQRYAHHFNVTAHTYTDSEDIPHTSFTSKVRPSGLDFIAKKLGLVAVGA